MASRSSRVPAAGDGTVDGAGDADGDDPRGSVTPPGSDAAGDPVRIGDEPAGRSERSSPEGNDPGLPSVSIAAGIAITGLGFGAARLATRRREPPRTRPARRPDARPALGEAAARLRLAGALNLISRRLDEEFAIPTRSSEDFPGPTSSAALP